jgi:hypothetical protein
MVFNGMMIMGARLRQINFLGSKPAAGYHHVVCPHRTGEVDDGRH